MSPPLFATQSKPLHIYASEVVRLNVSVYFFAHFGVLLRVLLTASTKTVDDSILPEVGGSFFLQNVVGCCFMGLFAGCAELFTRAHLQFLQVGLAGGFCGSLTTFGGWVVAVAKEMLSSGHSQRINSTLKVLLNFGCSFMGLLFGHHLARGICPFFHRNQSAASSTLTDSESNNNLVNRQLQSEVQKRKRVNVATIVVVSLLVLSVTTFWLLSFYDSQRNSWWIAVCLGPTGALLRYNLSLLNREFPGFPVFTFIVNISASVAGMVIVMTTCSGGNAADGQFQFWVVNGVSVGLLGCLSTVSTFINELNKLSAISLFSAYRYGLVSFLCSFLVCLSLGGFWILAGRNLSC